MKVFKHIGLKYFRRDKKPNKMNLFQRKRVVFKLETMKIQDTVVQHLDEELYLNTNTKRFKCLRRATKENFMHNGTFHEAIAPVLCISECFGIMPVRGITSKDASGLSFRWCNLRTIYSLIIITFLVLHFILSIYIVFIIRPKLSDIDPLIFHGSGVVVFLVFINLARKWPKLMLKWQEIENQLPKYQSEFEKASLAYKIKMITLVILMMSLTEHVLSIITHIHTLNFCKTGADSFETFFKIHLNQVFYVTDFSPWKAIFAKFLNVIATFTWSYMDIFVMVISVGLSEKFRQVNESMFRVKGLMMPEIFWQNHRGYYQSLCELCEHVDDAISIITMVSFSNNLYFICIQLLRSLNHMPSISHTVYFWFSMIFLIGRTLAVSLYASDIYDESKRSIAVFRCVPRESWCLEVKRFSKEVNTGKVALSGMRFFHLTRSVLMTVAGTIVTYELVLFQFQIYDEIGGEC